MAQETLSRIVAQLDTLSSGELQALNDAVREHLVGPANPALSPEDDP